MNSAVYALVGTVLGVAASLLGSYMTSEQQANLDAIATKREAFAAFIAEYTEYSRHLRDLAYFRGQGDDERVEAEWAATLAQSTDLATARGVVVMVGDPRAAEEANLVTGAMFDVTRQDWREMTDQEISASVMDGVRAITITAFIEAARADLADE